MKVTDKTIFIALMSIIIVLIGFMGISFLKIDKMDILTTSGNNVVKLIKKKKTNLSISSNTYENNNIKITYPSIEKKDNINEIIYKNVTSIIDNHEYIEINYEIKFLSNKLISIIFYGTIDGNNYSHMLNIDILKEKIILFDDVFKNKNQAVIILKSTYTSDYLENPLKKDYLDYLTYDELLNSNDIDIYFTKDKIGISICNIPKALNDYYLSVEIEYDKLSNAFKENEYVPYVLDENNLKEFLIKNYISKNNRAISTYPSGYVFMENGNFSYNNGEELPSYDGQLLSYRGNYIIDSGKIILHVTEEEKVVEKESNDGIFNYDKQVNNVDYNIEYSVDKINNSYVILNNYNLVLYGINIDTNYLNNFRILADKGYKDYNISLENYYNTLGE